MSNSIKLSSKTPSSFLARLAMACPPDLLAIAGSSDPQAFVFVRAIGAATLQTARDAAKAGLPIPFLLVNRKLLLKMLQAIGWDLLMLKLCQQLARERRLMRRLPCLLKAALPGLRKVSLHTDVFMGGIVKRTAGIRTGKRLVHIFVMFPPAGGRPLMISDAAVNVAPDIDTRVEGLCILQKLVAGWASRVLALLFCRQQSRF